MTNNNDGDCGFYNHLSLSVVNFFLIYFTLGCPVILNILHLHNQSKLMYLLKLKYKCSQLSLFIRKSANVLFDNNFHRRISLDHVGIHNYF